MEDIDIVVLESILAGTKEPRRLRLEILKRITDGFSKHREIGGGGFGVVFKGYLPEGKIVAVKRLFFDIKRVDDNKFIGEVTSLLKVKHPNVIRFLGFCSRTELIHTKVIKEGSPSFLLPEERERLLCFEYISNGSLDKHISDELRGLGWNTRYEIIKGICKGLKYLHETVGIIHMDLKPANIMVDSGMVPKITDFGLSRPKEISCTTGDRFGTIGYCAPEYANHGVTKSTCDIYSPGVIIIELVTGCKGYPNVKNVLRRWRHTWNNMPIPTPLHDQQVNECQITKCIEIAKQCMVIEPGARPSISTVTQSLDDIRNINCHIPGKISPWVDDMLRIEPLDLQIAFEPDKEISCDVVLTNRTRNCMAFNIQMPNMYRTVPQKGIVQLNSEYTVKITLKAREMIPGELYSDETIVKSVKVDDAVKDDNVSQCMFITNNEAGKVVDEVNFRVVYIEKKKLEQSHELPSSQPIEPSPTDINYGQRTYRLNFHPQQTALVIDENCRYETSDRAVDLMTGAMGSLLPKLGELIEKEEHNLQSVKEDFESLMDQLRDVHVALCNVSQEQLDQLGIQDKRWANEVRQLSYDLEDMVDSLLVSIENSEPITNQQDGFRGLIRKMINIFEWGRTPYHIAHLIKDIIIRVNKSNLQLPPSLTNNNHSQAVTWTCDRLSAFYKDPIGIEVPRDKIVDVLINGSGVGSSTQKLKIISIFGAGGLGKTTLAKAVYDKLPPGHFVCKAFVSVGRNPDTKRVLEEILLELDKKEYGDIHNKGWNEMTLINELRDVVLNNKRYLIVIDDLWDIPSWEKIKYALRDDSCGSRIITTSRISHVAQRSGEACELQPLGSDDSKKLFSAIILSRKCTFTFGHLEEECTKHILEKCGGVPLAIITIASLLSAKEPKDWPKVYNSIGFGNERNTDIDNTRKILLCSYYDLPWHLKTCLLYLSLFPQYREIEKDTLVWRWVAEGFVHEEHGNTVFKVGERYFYELINRSLIQPLEEKKTCIIYACHVHDMVLDMIYSMAKQENFVDILDSDGQHLSSFRQKKHLSSRSGARILALQKRPVLEQDELAIIFKRNARSFSGTGCRIAGSMMSLLFPSFQVLRVLSLDGCTTLTGDAYHIENLVGLHLLRYLGLNRMHLRELPMEIGKLRSLQTLDFRDTKIETLPHSVTLPRQLKCLQFNFSLYFLPAGIGNLTSLEQLHLCLPVDSLGFGKQLEMLTQLRVLRIYTHVFLGNSWNEEFVQSLNNLQKIEELLLVGGGLVSETNWESFSPSVLLRYLRLDIYGGLPEWINASLVPNLIHLDVYVRYEKVNQHVVDILGTLPELRSLVVSIGNEPFFNAVTPAGAFPKLRYCYMRNLLLSYKHGAMPCLESVGFHVNVRALEDAKYDFKKGFGSLRFLGSLGKVDVIIWCTDAKREEVEEAEASLRHTVDNHDNRPILVLDQIGYCKGERVRSKLLQMLLPASKHLVREQTNNDSNYEEAAAGAEEKSDSQKIQVTQQESPNEIGTSTSAVGKDSQGGASSSGLEPPHLQKGLGRKLGMLTHFFPKKEL